MISRVARIIVVCSVVIIAGFSFKSALKAAQQASYVGTDNCVLCHSNVQKDFQKMPRGNAHLEAKGLKEASGCEACHGPGSLHTEDEAHKQILNPKNGDAKTSSAPCLKCHTSVFRAQEFAKSPHGQNKVGCRDCHSVHTATKEKHQLKQPINELCLSCHKKQKAEFKQNSHHPVLEGRLQCVSCHDPHRSSHPAAKKDVKNLCVTCHADKKGPFVFEHDPISSGLADSCLTCHKSHGSPNRKLATLYGRGLCIQCHADINGDILHRNRSGDCWNCHRQIHGSHRDSRFLQ